MDRLSTAADAAHHGAAGWAIENGDPWPMGASVQDANVARADEQTEGVNFAVFSAHASRVELCLYDDSGANEIARLTLPGRTGDVWHGRVRSAAPGQVYGFRAHGAWRPERGQRFNPNKLLLDPWARQIVGHFDPLGPHCAADAEFPLQMDPRDNGRDALKARVVHDSFDWQGDTPPRTPLVDSVIYEAHVRGFTKLLPGVPAHERGTYAGMASDAAIGHLQRLGVTAISLLPVMQILDEPRLSALGLVNYWGYNTLGFFCPDPRYASTNGVAGHPRNEFRRMVQKLHAAGIEVLMDVVFNHTPEGDERGPTLAWRGMDNTSWYRLAESHPERYENWSGCGNTLNLNHPRTMQFVLDSLRFWVGEMHIDGFRLDLAPVLGRGAAGFERDGAFFKALQQDPLLQRVKLIAEPWDLGPGGYQLGNFPQGWLEWNDRFRDTARAFWLGGDCTRGEFALRLAGSSDIFQPRRRPPLHSVNYVVSHDGFTLADLVSYNDRHNVDNGEDNRDGHGHNLSWNCGHEGPTDDAEVLACRARLQRALLATTLLAQGTPMLAAGDELGHTQRGNNNPYCQDNSTTWIDWSKADQSLIDFTAHVLALRKQLLPLGERWFTGVADGRGKHDLAWLRRNGAAMTPEFWDNHTSRILGAWISAPGRGQAALLLLVNGRDMDASFVLPPVRWRALLDSTQPDGRSNWTAGNVGELNLPSRSVMLLAEQA